MYTRKKSLAEEIFKSNADKNPSFSSTLLDEIYRSIDETDETNQMQQKPDENEEIVALRRSHLVEKWMDTKKTEEKIFTKRPPLIPDYVEKDQQQQLQLSQDNDPMFFSSTSNSSVSSSGVLSSSSDTEYFAAVEKTKSSCFFGPSWPKPIRTKVPPISSVVSVKTEDSLKSKLDALKVYDDSKNLKPQISPGARLTSFINAIFANGSSKKSQNRLKSRNNKKHSVYVGAEQNWCPFEPKITKTSACSSVSSFSRSILCKSPSTTSTSTTNTSKGKSDQEYSKRKVSFDPVSVVVDGEKGSRLKMEDSKVYQDQTKDDSEVERDESGCEDDEGYDDDEDGGSDCSSELFEIDHLALFGKKIFCEELPVYETTDLAKNLAIARGLMR